MKREYEKPREATAITLIICERKIGNRREFHALNTVSAPSISSITFCGQQAEGLKLHYPKSEAPLDAGNIECPDCRKAFNRAEKKAQAAKAAAAQRSS